MQHTLTSGVSRSFIQAVRAYLWRPTESVASGTVPFGPGVSPQEAEQMMKT